MVFTLVELYACATILFMILAIIWVAKHFLGIKLFNKRNKNG